MTKQKNYKKTLIACYLGFVTQAISANFSPLLFLTFISTYGITLEKIAHVLKTGENAVEIDEGLRRAALLPLEKMLELGN